MATAPVRSFDIFDTLVARRCVQPHNILRAVEIRGAHPGFADLRTKAEAELYRSREYTLDDIYSVLVTAFGLSEASAQHLKALELAEEFDNLIPVQEHIAEVRPGDLLISDMYLPRTFIARVVSEKCGLHFNPLFLSSHGKSSGRVWPTLTPHFQIIEHTGDSQHSDIDSPGRFGLKGRHTGVTQMSGNEVLLEQLGYRSLAEALRAARLALWNPDPGMQMLGRAQIEVNFPLLFVTSLLLIQRATRNGWRHLLFSSRDCFMLYLLFERLVARLGLNLRASYFYTSRIARSTPSKSYLNYFHSLCDQGPAAVVDLCGTGWSLTRLFELAGRPNTAMFLMHHVDSPHMMTAYRAVGAISREPVVDSVTRLGDNTLLEALNATNHGMVTDVIEAAGVFVPVFAEIPVAPRYTELVDFSLGAFKSALAASDSIATGEILHWLTKAQPAHAEAIYHQAMGKLGDATVEIRTQQLAENDPVYALMQARAAAATSS